MSFEGKSHDVPFRTAARNPIGACLRFAAVVALAATVLPGAASTITVNTLADDVFPDSTGAIFDVNGAPISLATAKCTLRMAVAAANLDLAVGGGNGCAAGDSESTLAQTRGLADTIRFSAGLSGTITINVTKKMSEAPATFRDPSSGAPSPNASSALVVSRPLVITGNTASGVPTVTLDGGLVGNGAANGRLLWVSDGSDATDTAFSLSNLALQNARVVGAAGGCLLSHESVFLSNVTFKNCVSEGNADLSGVGGALAIYTRLVTAIPVVRPDVRLQNVTVTSSKALRGTNSRASEAGGIALGSGFNFVGAVGNVSLSGVTLDNNEADNFGGICITRARNADVTHSVIRNNRASGPAVLDSGYTAGMRIQSSADVNLTEVQVLDNVASSGLAGFESRSNTRLTATGLTVTGNTINNDADIYTLNAGMRVANNVTVIGSRWNISNNVNKGSPGNGGGRVGGLSVENSTGSVMLRDLRVANNVCSDVSSCAMWFYGNASVDIQGMQSIGNVVTKKGSAWTGVAGFSAEQNTSLRLANADISGNATPDTEIVGLRASFADNNGALPPVAASPLPPTGNSVLIENSTISDNTAGSGFTVYIMTPGAYTFRNTTIAQNAAVAGCGGGITMQSYSPFSGANALQLRVQNSTIARNNAQCQTAIGLGGWDGAQSVAGSGTLTVQSSILGREAVNGIRDVIWATDPTQVTVSNTLIEDNAGPMNAQCNGSGNKCNLDPMLDALALNGGPTATMRLLSGSPAINAGGNPAALATDQRGAARVVGAAADMGAFESHPSGSVCNLDMDGDNQLTASKEGLVLLRAMLGFTGNAVTTGTGISVGQWAAARPAINSNCGTSFAP